MKVIAVSAHKAAELCGCKNVRQFKSEVKRGVWPKAAITTSRPHRWSVADLKSSLNKKSNRNSVEDDVHEIDKMLGLS